MNHKWSGKEYICYTESLLALRDIKSSTHVMSRNILNSLANKRNLKVLNFAKGC